MKKTEISGIMPQAGVVRWIGVRPARREDVNVVDQVQIDMTGLEGDHFGGAADSPRVVSLIQAEHVDAVASILEVEQIDPGLLRRNFVVSGINLLALRDVEFQIGDALLRGTDDCPPCGRMEENLGPGGYNAMCGHGGITAIVVKPGVVRQGDQVKLNVSA